MSADLSITVGFCISRAADQGGRDLTCQAAKFVHDVPLSTSGTCMYKILAIYHQLLGLHRRYPHYLNDDNQLNHTITMPQTVRAYFRGPHDYAHTLTTPDAEDVCMICRETYTDEPAIQLTSCGHIIGLNCFRDWIRCHPDTCPYWTHALPRLSSNRSFLESICSSKLFAWIEDYAFDFAAGVVGSENRVGVSLSRALLALHEDRLTLGDMMTIFCTYFLASMFPIAILVMFAILALLVILIALVLLRIATEFARPLLGRCGYLVLSKIIRVLGTGLDYLRPCIFPCAVGLLVVFMATIVGVVCHSIMHGRGKKKT